MREQEERSVWAVALWCVSTRTTTSTILTVPNIDEVLGDATAGAISEDDADLNSLWCLREEVEEEWLQVCLFVWTVALWCVPTGTTTSVVLTVPHVDEVLGETAARKTSEDEADLQLLLYLGAEGDKE